MGPEGRELLELPVVRGVRGAGLVEDSGDLARQQLLVSLRGSGAHRRRRRRRRRRRLPSSFFLFSLSFPPTFSRTPAGRRETCSWVCRRGRGREGQWRSTRRTTPSSTCGTTWATRGSSGTSSWSSSSGLTGSCGTPTTPTTRTTS